MTKNVTFFLFFFKGEECRVAWEKISFFQAAFKGRACLRTLQLVPDAAELKVFFFPPPLSHVSNLLSICLCYFSNFTYFTDNYVRSRNSCITNTDRIIDLLRNQFFLLLKKLALQKFFSVLKNSLYVRRKTQVYPLALLSPGSPLLTWELHKVVSSV